MTQEHNMSLNELADMVEKLTGPNDEIFMSAFHLVFPSPAQIWEEEEWTAEYEQWHRKGWIFSNFLDASAYLDAAMMLVPEGWEWQADTLKHGCEPEKTAWFRLHQPDYAEQFEADAATPALAVTAAALRALSALGQSRSSMEGEG